MRGGKRTGAGRKQGPIKKRLNTYVLPVTMREMSQRASQNSSLGDLLDKTFKPKKTKIS